MTLEITSPHSKTIRREVDSLMDAWYDIKYPLDKHTYQMFEQHIGMNGSFFWRWEVVNEVGEQSTWTLFMEV